MGHSQNTLRQNTLAANDAPMTSVVPGMELSTFAQLNQSKQHLTLCGSVMDASKSA
jgi:hypothetical protein